jgi:hypothetical protein
VPVYPVKIEGDDVYVAVEKEGYSESGLAEGI